MTADTTTISPLARPVATWSPRGMTAFRRLWLAICVSSLGDGARTAALPLMAATMTSDPRLVAGVLAANKVPWLLFALPGGAIADRFDRVRLVVGVGLARGLVVAALGLLVLTGFATLPILYLAAFCLGTGEVLGDSAMFAILPNVVRDEDLTKANGQTSAALFGANDFAGPALGGFLFAFAGFAPFVFDAASFAASAAVLSTLPPPPAHAAAPAASTARLRTEIAAGLRWLRAHPPVLGITVLGAAINFTLQATFVVMVLFAREHLGLGAVGFGLLLAVEAIGALAGSLLAARLETRLGVRATITGAIVLAGGANAVIAGSSHIVLVAVMMAGISFGGGLWNVTTTTLRQRSVPGHLLGRVQSVHRLICWGTLPVSALAGGAIANEWGVRAPFLVAAVGMALVGLTAQRLFSGGSFAAAAPGRLVAGDAA